jgi:hypothetical protein
MVDVISGLYDAIPARDDGFVHLFDRGEIWPNQLPIYSLERQDVRVMEMGV